MCQETPYDEIILDDFKVNGAASGVLGRCFIEVQLYLTVHSEILDEIFVIIGIFCIYRSKIVLEGLVFQ